MTSNTSFCRLLVLVRCLSWWVLEVRTRHSRLRVGITSRKPFSRDIPLGRPRYSHYRRVDGELLPVPTIARHPPFDRREPVPMPFYNPDKEANARGRAGGCYWNREVQVLTHSVHPKHAHYVHDGLLRDAIPLRFPLLRRRRCRADRTAVRSGMFSPRNNSKLI